MTTNPAPALPCDVDTFLSGVAAVSDALLRANAAGVDLADDTARQDLAVKIAGVALGAWKAAGAAVDLGAHRHD